MSASGLAAQFTELALAILLAPLLTGWVNQCRAWLQNKSAPPLLLPYRTLATIVDTLAHRELVIYPSMAFAGVAFTMVSLAENARIPIDNPATHLELTMIHEAMVLEYSGRHLAMIEWAASLKLFVYSCIGL